MAYNAMRPPEGFIYHQTIDTQGHDINFDVQVSWNWRRLNSSTPLTMDKLTESLTPVLVKAKASNVEWHSIRYEVQAPTESSPIPTTALRLTFSRRTLDHINLSKTGGRALVEAADSHRVSGNFASATTQQKS